MVGGERTYGGGSVIIDSLVVKEGRGITLTEPLHNAYPISIVPQGIPEATGFSPITIDAPTGSPETIISASGVLTADSGGTPVSEQVAAANVTGLRQLINQAKYTAGKKKIVVPMGVYRFSPNAAIQIDGIDDLTIDGQGSDFIYQKLYTGELFMITDCSRMVIENLNIDWEWSYMPIASLGKVVSLSIDKKAAEFEFVDLNAAQTLLASQMPWIGIFQMDPVSLWAERPSKFEMATTSLSSSGNHITATFANPVALEVNESYCIRHLYYQLIAFKLSNCQHLTFNHINIYSLPGMGWLNTGTSHHLQIINSSITRRSGSRHPLTTAADGVHANESAGDILISNCHFRGLGDDAINLHDNAWQGGLEYGSSNTELILNNCPKHRLRLQSGDVVEFFNADYSPTGVQLTVDGAPTFQGSPNEYAATTTATVNFTAPVPVGLSNLSIAINRAYDTRNVRIAGSTFQYTNGRAILLAGRDATIEYCYFRNVYSTSIQLHTEIVDNLWGEGHGADNIVIRHNTFENTNPSGRWEGSVIYGGATLPWGPTDYPLFDRILIDDNLFYNAPGPAVSLRSVRSVIVRDNRIQLSQSKPEMTAYSGTIYGTLCTNMALGGNEWRNWIAPSNLTGVAMVDSTTGDIELELNTLIDYDTTYVTEDFEGYSLGASFSTGQTIGSTGDGWAYGWKTSGSYAFPSGTVLNAPAVESGQFLTCSITTWSGYSGPTGSVSRAYEASSIREPYNISFFYRPDTMPVDVIYYISDSQSISAFGPNSSSKWHLATLDGTWQLLDGLANGGPNSYVDTEIPVVAGSVYFVSIYVDPVGDTWDATISDGTNFYRQRGLNARSTVFETDTAGLAPNGRWINFTSKEIVSSGSSVGVTGMFSIDSLDITY